MKLPPLFTLPVWKEEGQGRLLFTNIYFILLMFSLSYSHMSLFVIEPWFFFLHQVALEQVIRCG